MGARSEGDPGEAHQSQRPGNRRRRRAGRRVEAIRRATPCSTTPSSTKIVKAGVHRLTEMQLSDGGWGWFSGWGEQSTAHTTATVVHGLQIAEAERRRPRPRRARPRRRLAQDVSGRATRRARQRRQRRQAHRQGQAVQARRRQPRRPRLHGPGRRRRRQSDAMRDYLYRDRTKLAVYGLATLRPRARTSSNEAEKLAMVMRNISQYVVEDDENQTAYLNLPQNIWWYWYGSEFEAHAYYLKLLVGDRSQEPDRPAAREVPASTIASTPPTGTAPATRPWSSKRSPTTSRPPAKAKPDMTVEVWIDGQKRQEVEDHRREPVHVRQHASSSTGDALAAGRHTVELRKTRHRPALLQRLPHQLHARRRHPPPPASS